MTPEQIAKLQTDLKTAQDALATEKAGRAADKVASDKIVAQKDVVITQKNDDLVKLRKSSEKEYRLLKDMTEEEKGKMSEKEIELQQRTEKLAEDQRLFQEQQTAAQQKEVDARKERAITALAGKNPELAQKIRDNFARVVDHDKAQTEEEVAKVAGDAFNMLGIPKPAGVVNVANGGGNGADGGDNTTGFADTEQGKALSGAMNLPVAPVAGAEGAK